MAKGSGNAAALGPAAEPRTDDCEPAYRVQSIAMPAVPGSAQG